MSDLDGLLVLACVGVAAVLAIGAARATLVAVPAPDEAWRARPPRYWRFAAWVIGPTARLTAPLMPTPIRRGATRLLRHAGLDHALDAQRLLAGCWVAGAALGASAGLAASGAGIGASVTASAAAAAVVLGAWLPLSWVRERRSARRRAITRALPFCLDLITLSVESGANLTGALQHAATKGPSGPLQSEIERVLRDLRTGRTRSDALRALSERLELPEVSSWVGALVAAERNGSSLGPILRAQADQRRQERFQHAEKLAMRAPVKMLAPLLLCFFPCTFVLLFFPVVVRLLEEGLLR
jgi:tight adherence protein C